MSFNAFGESPGANAIRWLALAAQAAPPADTRRIVDLP
jgi:hypothetical protein